MRTIAAFANAASASLQNPSPQSPNNFPHPNPNANQPTILSLEPTLPEIRGQRMKIGSNNCPSELRRPIASPYAVIQKYSKAYYAKKQYWCKVYEVEYSLIRNPVAIGASSCECKEEPVQGTSKKSFVAATGDEIGLYAEGETAEDAVSELQAKISARILGMLEQGQSHCLPSKRKYQDVLLKDFEEEMVSHGVRILSTPKHVCFQIAFGMAVKKQAPPTSANAEANKDQEQATPPPPSADPVPEPDPNPNPNPEPSSEPTTGTTSSTADPGSTN